MNHYIADGYYPDGKGRPWLKVEIVTIQGRLARVRRVDTNEELMCPVSGVHALTKEQATKKGVEEEEQ